MKIAFIGTYPPRQCGIGTFTHNLVKAVVWWKIIFQYIKKYWMDKLFYK